MILTSATVGPFRSMNTPQTVAIDPDVTVLVGMNEAGKTVLLKALQKCEDAIGLVNFDPVEDYPRKDLSAYLKRHKTAAEEVVRLTYQLDANEIETLNNDLGTKLPKDFTFTVHHKYDNTVSVAMSVDERPLIADLLQKLSTDAKNATVAASSLRSIPELLTGVALTESDQAVVDALTKRIAATKWSNLAELDVWIELRSKRPKFLYFSDYDLMPGKVNLADLSQRVDQAKSDPKMLRPEHRAILALMRMADFSLTDLTSPGGYEELKAKIEGVSISLTDQVMEFWKQNSDLEVEVDVKADPTDEAPFSNGPNLYLRIKNRRHRGVTTPFDQRSRGFIWFFSFLVWFDSVQHQLDASGSNANRDLILLLDEPGLALHALAQADFLRYIDRLAESQQVLYTTHSPFMVHSDRLHQVRLVEDRATIGTVVSDNLNGSDPRTIFPLQAALGWSIAQNLFISERNLLVEGPSELIYLQLLSAILDADGGGGLRDDITIVPTGGLDNVVTFVALLGASGLKLAVLHDYKGSPEQKLTGLVRQKLLNDKALFNVSQFRDTAAIGQSGKPADIEDLFTPGVYIDYFNAAFTKQLGETKIVESDLPKGDRIVERLERYIAAKNIVIRPTGGFNHYAVASRFAAAPPKSIDAATKKRFKALFTSINAML